MSSVGVMGAEAATATSSGSQRWTMWRRPPGLAFHVVMAAGALLGLFAVSVPLVSFGAGAWAFVIVVSGAVVWGVRAVTYTVARREGRALGHSWWLVIAPIGAVLTLAIAVADLPLRVRWALSREEFEDAVVAVRREPDGGEWSDRRIGLYDISGSWTQGDAVLFTEATGGFMASGGFAYLPDGPASVDSDLDFRHLSGPWYTWT